MKPKDNQGFSLVEMAVIITVIGVLIGGVLKGRELIDNARINKFIITLKTMEQATINFKDAYGELPGDFRNPSRLKNCTTTPCTVTGNGDGQIGTASGTVVWAHGPNDENRTYWVHLGKSELIALPMNIDYTGTPDTLGVDFPKMEIGGGLIAGVHVGNAYKTQVSNLDDGGGNNVMLGEQVARIDRKVDDGMPETGKVRGISSFGCVTPMTDVYPERDRTKRCDLAWMWQ